MAIIDTKEFNTTFPKNKIVLLNGKELICHPKVECTDNITDDELKIDTTGTFLSVGKKSQNKVSKKVMAPNEQLFLDNAFYFLNNADKIFSDSRMFLAPVPIQSGIAYTGTSGFHNPTLGVYLEWWLNCETDVTKDKKGRDALTYYIAGSPLSGMNHCACVYPDGKSKDISHYPFREVWSTFMKINNRYSESKAQYEAYTLEEVVNILKASDLR